MIDQRLKEMASLNRVKRDVLSTRPIAVAHEITDFGKTALGVLEEMKSRAEKYQI